MIVKMALKLKHFEKMENLVMKEKRLPVIYGGMLVIVLIVKRKKFLNKTILEDRQRQAAQCNTLEDFFTIVHNEFLGSTTHYTEVAREEFLLMKCCSLERGDLEKHFDRMSRR